jgi:predicted deacylase
MLIQQHPLAGGTPGTVQELTSLHFGEPGRGPKVLVQAALHADETPGMLVVHHLRQRLASLEAEGLLAGEVVLVPVANPIGLGQRVLHDGLGRFDLASGENFNRHYADLTERAAQLAEPALGPDAEANVQVVRAALRQAVAEIDAAEPLPSLRRALLSLACDADLVLDLHCDCEAVLHAYTGTPLWPQAEALVRYLGAEATLLATESGDQPFDEACSQPWWRLAERWAGRFPLPLACLAVTVELRGYADVDHALALRDAQAILDFLAWRKVVQQAPPPLPPLKRPPQPLAGSMPVAAPCAGVLAFRARPGDLLRQGDLIAEVVDPLTGEQRPLLSPVDGLLYAREHRRFVTAGMRVAKVSGSQALRSGKLLSL